jgi:hypothetical protein
LKSSDLQNLGDENILKAGGISALWFEVCGVGRRGDQRRGGERRGEEARGEERRGEERSE